MKTLILCTLVLSLLSTNSYARRGENDQPGNGDDGRMIKCVDVLTQATLLQFSSAQAQGQVSTDNFDLLVKTRGDDIAEMTLADKRSGDSVRAKSLEELLKVFLTTDESTAPFVAETPTRHGYAELEVVAQNSGDKVQVRSHSRRGLSWMELNFVTDELSASPLKISCSNAR